VLAGGAELLRTGGRRVTRAEICELSLVTIPANAAATIRLIKSLDTRHPMNPTIAEQITHLETKRADVVGRMTAIMDGAGAEPLAGDVAATYDGLAADVTALEADITRRKAHEKLTIAAARPVPASRHPYITVTDNTEPGIHMARYVIAKMAAKLDGVNAADYAERRWGGASPVTLELKAAVAAGSTTDATWAKPLVNPAISGGLIELLRSATILGKIPGLNNVPFNVQVPQQTAGAAVNWVGELKPKPVSAMAFSTNALGFAKVATIVPLSQELIRFSNPKAEQVVRNSLVKDIAAFLDAQFTDPAVAAVAGIHPASITNGAPTAAATAAPLADILGLINHFATNNIPVDGLVFIMSPANALALSFRTYSDGSPQFPGIGVNGGTWKGMTVIVSNTVTTNVIALQPAYILYADDGGVTIDTSTEASLQMDSAPDSPVLATTVMVSMFQMNAVAIRAERYVNWLRAVVNSVKYLTAANWPSPTGLTLGAQAAADEDVHTAKKR
jgi:HK97 family phage major capsid protein